SVDRAARYAGRLQYLDPMIGRIPREHRFHLAFECGAVLHARRIRRKARILAPLGVTDRLGAALPDRLPRRTNHQIAVFVAQALIRRVLPVARAFARRFLAVDEPLRAGPGTETDRGFEQRAFDKPALASTLPLIERGEDPLHGPHAGAEI